MPSLIATLGANISGFVYELNSAKGKAQAAGADIGSSLGGALKSKLGQIASIGAVEEAIRKTIEYADQVDELGMRLGMSAESVQRWDFALSQTGGSIDGVARFFEKLAMARQQAMQGGDKQIDSFQRLGVTMDDLKGKRLEDIAVQIGEAFKVGDPQALIADLRAVGGKSAGELVAAFRLGIQGLLDEASPMWDESAARLGELGDRAQAVWMRIRGGFGDMLSFVVGGFEKIAKGLDIALSAHVGGVVALFRGENPIQSALDAGRSKSAEYDASEKANSARRQAMREAQLAGSVEIENEKQREKAEKEREKREERISKLKEQLFDKQAAAYIAELSGQEKIDALLRRRALLEPMAAQKYGGNLAQMTEEDILRVQLEGADIDREIAAARKSLDKDAAKGDKALAKADKLDINSLQRIGAYVQNPEGSEMLRTARESKDHLAYIHTQLERIASMSRGGRTLEF
jgi:hypothetical protein